jgi:streptogramin lyase
MSRLLRGVVAAGAFFLCVDACSSEPANDEESGGEDDLTELPGELQNIFPGLPELKGSSIRRRNLAGRAKLDPHTGEPLVVFHLPVGVSTADVIASFVTPRLDGSYALVEAAAGTYAVTYAGTLIESAWVRVLRDKRGGPVVAMSLPTNGLAPIRFVPGTRSASGLALVGGTLTEIHREPQGGPDGQQGDRVDFPNGAGLPGKAQKTLTATRSPTATVTKITVDEGTFPDEIGQTRTGDIWFSQPFQNVITGYAVATGTWTHVPVGREPDGLWVDRHDNVWFGEYQNKALGFYSTSDKAYVSYPVPAALGVMSPAIPYEDSAGLIWVADHEANQIYRFDPVAKAFEAYKIPTPSSWPVGIGQADDPNVVYVAETYAHKLAVFDKTTKAFTEYVLSINGGTAFFGVHDGALWFTEWSQPGFVRFDLATHDTTEYLIADGTNALLGPATALPSGELAFGGLSNGRVYLFDAQTESLVYVDTIGLLKDGITPRASSEVWVTESGQVVDRIDWVGAPGGRDGGADGAPPDAAARD